MDKSNATDHGMYLKGFMWCHRCIFGPDQNKGVKICPYYEKGKQCSIEIEEYKGLFNKVAKAYGLNETADKLILDRLLMNILRARRGERYEAFYGITDVKERLLNPKTGETTLDIFETPVAKYLDRIDGKIHKFADALRITRKSQTPSEVRHSLGDISQMLTGIRTKTTVATKGDRKIEVIETEYSKEKEEREPEKSAVIVKNV